MSAKGGKVSAIGRAESRDTAETEENGSFGLTAVLASGRVIRYVSSDFVESADDQVKATL